MNKVFGYREICEGRTLSNFQGKPIYFYHQSLFDQCYIEERRDKHANWAKSHGYDSKEQALERAIRVGDWTKEREENFKQLLQDYRDVWARRSKIDPISIVHNVRGFHATLRQIRAEIDIEAAQRSIVTSRCQETYGHIRSFDYEIALMTRDENGKQIFTEEEFDEMSNVDLVLLRNNYTETILQYDEEYMEQLSIAPFFYSIFDNYVANPGDFFKKPAPELTVLQMDLLKNAKRYNEVIKIAWDAPPDFYEDAKMLETYAIIKNRADSSGGEVSGAEVKNEIQEMRRKRN